jgi:hypothetical protein
MGSSPTFLSPSVRRKVLKTFPLDLEQILAETYMLNAAEFGAFMRCMMHHWMHGSLPEKGEHLAKIMGIVGENADASCIASCIALCIGDASRLRDDMMVKRQKRHEICVNAANARWAQKGQMEGENVDASCMPDASPEKGKRKGSAPPKEKAKISPPRSSTPRKEHEVYTPLPQGGLPYTPTQNERKAKPRKTTLREAEEMGSRGEVAPGRIDAAYPARNASNGHFKNGVNGSETDPRFRPFRKEVFRFWVGVNPDQTKCPWLGAESAALNRLLLGSPDLTLDDFKRILANRAHSEVNHTEAPRYWLGGALKYIESSLDRYGQPMKPQLVF